MVLPEEVKNIIKQIMESGGQAFLVGGALRDHLLGIPVTDYDVATSFEPHKIEDIFKEHKTYPTGKRFGTITVAIGNLSVEVTTFRKEDEYSDNRHPDRVAFVSDIESDLCRRDFTINAMAYNPYIDSSFIDPYSGMDDLEQKKIRTVGDPHKRFQEDPLRVLRGIRFAAQLDFELDEKTKEAMIECRELLSLVSRERIRDELSKLLLSSHPDKGLILLQETGILSTLLSVANKIKPAALSEMDLQVLKAIHRKLDYRLAALLFMLFPSDMPMHKSTWEMISTKLSNSVEEYIKDLLISLRLDNKSVNHILKLIEAYKLFISMDITPYHMRKLMGMIGAEDLEQVLHWYAISQKISKDKCEKVKYTEAAKILYTILENNDPVMLSQLAINGDDILKSGIGNKDGRKVGEALQLAYEWVLKDPKKNNADLLILKLKDWYRSQSP